MLKFTVRVKAEKGTIKNSAIVNGKTTEETETGIINITGKKEVNTSEAKSWRYINIYNYINK